MHDKTAFGKWGVNKIRTALRAKGISQEIIDECVSVIDADAQRGKLDALLDAKARQLLRSKRFAALDGNADTDDYEMWTLSGDFRNRLLRHAASQGYDYADIMSAVERIMSAIGK